MSVGTPGLAAPAAGVVAVLVAVAALAYISRPEVWVQVPSAAVISGSVALSPGVAGAGRPGRDGGPGGANDSLTVVYPRRSVDVIAAPTPAAAAVAAVRLEPAHTPGHSADAPPSVPPPPTLPASGAVPPPAEASDDGGATYRPAPTPSPARAPTSAPAPGGDDERSQLNSTSSRSWSRSPVTAATRGADG